jgi:hypothetical protein
VPVTEPTIVVRRLTDQEIPEWFGTFTMEPQTIDAVLGATGTFTYTLATTPSSFCIRTGGGSGCSFTGDGSNLYDEPQTLPQIGMQSDLQSGRWTMSVLAPPEVQLRLITSTAPQCELQPFTLDPYAPAVLWACESTSPAPVWFTIQGVRGDDTVVFETRGGGAGIQAPQQMLEELFGAKCLEGAADQPSNFVPRSIELDGIPSPSEDTGAHIGSTEGQDIPRRDPMDARYWIPVGIGDEVVGYTYVPNDQRSVGGSDFDCHPESAIYDEEGVLIGGFYNGPPVIVDHL